MDMLILLYFSYSMLDLSINSIVTTNLGENKLFQIVVLPASNSKELFLQKETSVIDGL